MRVLNRAFDHPMEPEELAAIPLAGGIMQHGYQCGMIWGATLAAGAQAYRLLGPGPQAETAAIIAAQSLLESFRAQNKHINCAEITSTDRSSSKAQMFVEFFVKGGTLRCMRMAARYCTVAFEGTKATLSEERGEASLAPVSCSAMLAQRMGASEMHTVMAAGLAGGIGLSGGACGALGAAIWLFGLNSLKAGADKIAYNDSKALDIVGNFIKCGGHEFECAGIVGRKFDTIGDHAGYLRNGGCANIIEALAVGCS